VSGKLKDENKTLTSHKSKKTEKNNLNEFVWIFSFSLLTFVKRAISKGR
jgi:hypothetical protein